MTQNQKALAGIAALLIAITFFMVPSFMQNKNGQPDMITLENKTSKTAYVAFFKSDNLRRRDGKCFAVASNKSMEVAHPVTGKASRIVAVSANKADLKKGADISQARVHAHSKAVVISTPCCGPTMQPAVSVR